MDLLKKFLQEEDGQDLVEYALLLVLLALAAIVAINTLGTSINSVFSNAANTISNPASSSATP